KGAVAKIHHGFDTSGDEDWRRSEDLSESLAKFGHASGERLRLVQLLIDIGEQQYRKQSEHPERSDYEVGHSIAGREIHHEAANERPSGGADVVRRRVPAKPSAAPSLRQACHIG